MTEREAIANIECARKWLGRESDFSDEALDMAISALEKQEADKCCETCKYKDRRACEPPCCDCYLATAYEDCYEAEEDNG